MRNQELTTKFTLKDEQKKAEVKKKTKIKLLRATEQQLPKMLRKINSEKEKAAFIYPGRVSDMLSTRHLH